jgi:hypothetical protein
MGIVKIVHGQANLSQVIGTLRASCGIACRLDSGQEQGHEHANDRDDH